MTPNVKSGGIIGAGQIGQAIASPEPAVLHQVLH
jgi:hypothetical protein